MDDGEKIASSPVRGTAAPNPRRGLKVLASSRRRPLSRFEVAIMHDNGAIWVIYRGGEQGRHWAGEIPCPGDAVPHAPPPSWSPIRGGAIVFPVSGSLRALLVVT